MKRTLYLALLLIGTLVLASCAEITEALPDNGKLYIQLTDLPADANAGVVVRGPGEYEKTIEFETTLEGLNAGRYTVIAKSVVFGGETYTPDKELERVGVERNETKEYEITYTK